MSTTFSPDGRRVVAASLDGTARIWDAASGKRVSQPFRGYAGGAWGAVSPDGKRIVTASFDI